jgi:hypothetical protein
MVDVILGGTSDLKVNRCFSIRPGALTLETWYSKETVNHINEP